MGEFLGGDGAGGKNSCAPDPNLTPSPLLSPDLHQQNSGHRFEDIHWDSEGLPWGKRTKVP